MYENIYTHTEIVNGKGILIMFKPNFREELALYNEKDKIFSDGEIRIEREDEDFTVVYASEDAQWLLQDRGYAFWLYVTERTNKIETPLGEEWNKEFNRLLKKCKKDYYNKKKDEVRLYFYNAERNKLSIFYNDEMYYTYYKITSERCKYSFSRRDVLPFDPYCAIDKRYNKPEKSCFILGRVRKTIGLKNSKLLDFIEPIYTVELDFEKDPWNFGKINEWKINELGRVLLRLLYCCISKKEELVEVMRIRAYLKDYEGDSKEVISQFREEIWEAFKNGDTKELRKLEEAFCKPQDCTDVKFKLKLNSEEECLLGEILTVYYENGEIDFCRPVDCVYEEIANCTDASAEYLGQDRYKFY